MSSFCEGALHLHLGQDQAAGDTTTIEVNPPDNDAEGEFHKALGPQNNQLNAISQRDNRAALRQHPVAGFLAMGCVAVPRAG